MAVLQLERDCSCISYSEGGMGSEGCWSWPLSSGCYRVSLASSVVRGDTLISLIWSSPLNVQHGQMITNFHPSCRLTLYLLSIQLFSLLHFFGVSDMLMLELFNQEPYLASKGQLSNMLAINKSCEKPCCLRVMSMEREHSKAGCCRYVLPTLARELPPGSCRECC